MRRLLSLVIALCFILSLASCGTKEPEVIREESSSYGVSSGDVFFSEGNIKFSVPAGTYYNLTQGKITSDSSVGVTVCYMGRQNSDLVSVATESIICAQMIARLEESGITDALAFQKDFLLDKYAEFTKFEDLYMGIAGKDITFFTFKEDARNPELMVVACFSDSMYVYTVETTISKMSEDYYMPFIEMLVGSEYIGTENTTKFNQ